MTNDVERRVEVIGDAVMHMEYARQDIDSAVESLLAAQELGAPLHLLEAAEMLQTELRCEITSAHDRLNKLMRRTA